MGIEEHRVDVKIIQETFIRKKWMDFFKPNTLVSRSGFLWYLHLFFGFSSNASKAYNFHQLTDHDDRHKPSIDCQIFDLVSKDPISIRLSIKVVERVSR